MNILYSPTQIYLLSKYRHCCHKFSWGMTRRENTSRGRWSGFYNSRLNIYGVSWPKQGHAMQSISPEKVNYLWLESTSLKCWPWPWLKVSRCTWIFFLFLSSPSPYLSSIWVWGALALRGTLLGQRREQLARHLVIGLLLWCSVLTKLKI